MSRKPLPRSLRHLTAMLADPPTAAALAHQPLAMLDVDAFVRPNHSSPSARQMRFASATLASEKVVHLCIKEGMPLWSANYSFYPAAGTCAVPTPPCHHAHASAQPPTVKITRGPTWLSARGAPVQSQTHTSSTSHPVAWLLLRR
jgi:hypothetical protein